MATADRLRSEQAFHDQQAVGRAAVLAGRPGALIVQDADYLAHETWIAPAFRRLGEVKDRAILDYGCGHGMAAVILARRGARVTALDLSPGYLAETAARARANAVNLHIVQGDGQRLPFRDSSFDRVWGNAILHHLDTALAARELYRVLRPDGWAVLCEPWGGNPVLRWARRRLHYPGKGHTPDEEPLLGRHVEVLRQVFPCVERRGFQFLSMARRVLPPGRLVRGLEQSDRLLLSYVPFFQRLCRYVVLTLRR